MENEKIIHIIGCGVLAPDIKHIVQQQGLNVKMNFLPGGLHNAPDELRRRLQEAIDQSATDPLCSRIVVGYGVCGKGSIGIRAPRVPLVFPRVHDCIALFMGSDRAYKREFEKYPGTFYISSGWYREKEIPKEKEPEKIWVGSESMGCRELKDQYGEEGGGKIIDFFSSWHHNYQRAAFIDTGIGTEQKSAEHARKMAEKYNWKYERIPGNLSLMTRLLTQDVSDGEIVIVPPGHVTIYSALENGLDSAPDTDSALAGRGKPRHLVYDEEDNDGLSIHYGLGIDAGGTYTDASVYDFNDKKIVDKNKALTTKWDFSIGIDEVLSGIDSDALSKVELVSVSTTLATNAIVEGEGQKTGLILMVSGGHVADDLISHTPRCNVKGQINISGGEVEPVDEDEIRNAVRHMVDRDNVTAFAVSGFAGAVNPDHELAVKRIINEETGLVACCGHELSDLLNFVVRAQTAVLNARIIPRMIKFFRELGDVLKKRGIHAPVMVVKGDGTLMSAAMAEERPVETVLSGPAASVAGAKLLTGLEEAMVVDMGGTTTDTADICEGLVDVCESGANVGGFVTHVKALDMRTVGLGGDSLIRWNRDEFVIGPRRVGPIVWANAVHPQGVKRALQYMENHQLSMISQTLLVAMEGKFSFEPTPNEQKVYDLLRKRPHTPEELLPHLNILAVQFLPLERLEESGLVQRCGLTPTDLLHVKGEFTKWDAEPARCMVNIMSIFSKKSKKELIDTLLNQVEMDLALELLKKQMARDFAMDEMENTPVFKQLMKQIVNPENSRYAITAQFNHPVIGIGAPVHYFLPQAGKRLNARVIIPENADVANAVGAITSHIMIKRKLSIKTDSFGRFVVEGVAGNQQFISIGQAEAWAVEYLKDHVQELGRCAGTSRKTVAMDIEDRVVNTGGGIPLFLGRTIVATLSGSPNMVLRAVNE
jgi:N-methylhydantoinase A/oxoprolinase/acetone carboxylase beta subunit